MSEHTKTPWRVSQGHFIDSWIGDGLFQEVAYCGDCEHGDRKANAKHIVHCVNNMPKVVDALQKLMDATPQEYDWTVLGQVQDEARTLLAALEAEKGGE